MAGLVIVLLSCGSDSPNSPGALTCSVSPTSGDAPLEVVFSASGKSTDPGDYHWTFSDATGAFGQKVTRLLSGGVYTGSVKERRSGEECKAGPVSVGAAVRVSCAADPDEIVAPREIHFRADASGGGGPFGFVWDFGDGASSREQNPYHGYRQKGKYTAKVTASSGAFSGSCAKDVKVFEDTLNVACSADPTSGPAPLKVKFIARGFGGDGQYDITWVLGDGTITKQGIVEHKYPIQGVYDTLATVKSGGEAGSCGETIYVGRPIVCGDGFIDGAEACDDKNTTNADGCSDTCQVEHGFTCVKRPSKCKSTCGDGLVASNEACDDSNTTNGDGCDSTCKVETGFTCSGEPSVCV